MPFGWIPCGGSQWWCLTRDAVAHVITLLDKNPKLKRFFQHTNVPDEIVFQTVLFNSPFADQIISDDLHYIDWTRPNPNVPRTFVAEDVGNIAGSNKFFARKFDLARDSTIFDYIDQRFLGWNALGTMQRSKR